MDKQMKNRILSEAYASAGMNKTASANVRQQDPYPSPLLNLSDYEIPETSLSMFKWCRYFYMFDPIIAGSINALSTFPVTELHLEEPKTEVENKRRHLKELGKLKEKGAVSDEFDAIIEGGQEFLTEEDKNELEEIEEILERESDTLQTYRRVINENLSMHQLIIEIGIDYHLYGNCFIFGTMGVGPDGNKEWKQMIRLDPSRIRIDYNQATGEKKYQWTLPDNIKRIVNNKSPKSEYEKIPEIMKQAVKKNKPVLIKKENIYHFKRASDSMGDDSWGTPVIANVFKLLLYRNVLRQAQEAIAREHIVPMRVYYFEETQRTSVMGDYSAAAADFATQLEKSVRDPNYKVVSPIPVNMLTVGGNGRALMLTSEIEQVQSEILAGMNVPREFIFGGVSYSGSSISLKILENQFITYRVLLEDFLQNFVIKQMAKARNEWKDIDDDESLVSIKLSELKMQDDVQQKQLVVQLNSAGKCSDELMWKTLGFDPDKMREQLKSEAEARIRHEADLQRLQMAEELNNLDIQLKLQLKQFTNELKLQRKQMEIQEQMMMLGMMPPPEEGMVDPETGMPMEGTEEEMQGEEMQGGEMPQEEGPPMDEQQEEPEEMDPDQQLAEEFGVTIEVVRMAKQLRTLDEANKNAVLADMDSATKEILIKIIQRLDEMEEQEKGMQIDMTPLPEQKPPRRSGM